MLTVVQRAGTCSRAGNTAALPRDEQLNVASPLTTTSCSKEDEDILKAEYQKNPKPDKTARLDIVSKVALGEKEVQVSPHHSIHVTRARKD